MQPKCCPDLIARLQNCLALVAEVTAEAGLLYSDFRTAVPFSSFLHPKKKDILALSLLKVGERGLQKQCCKNVHSSESGYLVSSGPQKAEHSRVYSIRFRMMILCILNL